MRDAAQLEKDLAVADIVNGKLVKKLDMLDNAVKTWETGAQEDPGVLISLLRSILDDKQQPELVEDDDVVEIDETEDLQTS